MEGRQPCRELCGHVWSEHIWSNRCKRSSLRKSVTIHCRSPRLWPKEMRKCWYAMGITNPVYFTLLVVLPTYAIVPGRWDTFYFVQMERETPGAHTRSFPWKKSSSFIQGGDQEQLELWALATPHKLENDHRIELEPHWTLCEVDSGSALYLPPVPHTPTLLDFIGVWISGTQC